MRSLEFQNASDGREAVAEKRPRSVLQKVRSKLLAGTLVAGSLFGVGATLEEPLRAQQLQETQAQSETMRPQSQERTTSDQDRITMMRGVTNVLRKSQPENIEPELNDYYNSIIIREEKNPARFTPEAKQNYETRLPEKMSFEGGVITQEQLKRYINTLPAAWRHSFKEIQYYEGVRDVKNGLKDIASVNSETNTMTFYRQNAEHVSLQFLLKSITHETAHKILGKYIDFDMKNPNGNSELSERVLYALMQRLKAPDRFNGGEDAGYLGKLTELSDKNPGMHYTLAREYLAIIASQYIEDPRQLARDDFHLVALLIAVDTEHFDLAGSFGQRAEITKEIKRAGPVK